MPKKFNSVEERRVYWRAWYENNKDREDYKASNKATKKRIKKERRSWYLELKSTLQCEHCKIDDFRVLDFHHRDPLLKTKEVSLLALRAASKEKILSEIEKCKVLCSNCHRIEHWKDRSLEENKI
jgi:hypothetical protein